MHFHKSLRLLFASLLFSSALTNAAEPRLKVFILAGQSNMEGHGMVEINEDGDEGKGTLAYLVTNPNTADHFAQLKNEDGQWKVRDDVWIHYFDRQGPLTVGYGARETMIGPELGFGNVVGDHFQEPILLIKLAWGGKSLAQDFRPPSAGGETGPYYKEIVTRTQDVLENFATYFPKLKGAKPELSGIGWHQGWNDRVNQAFNDAYPENMAHFIRDIRRDLGVANLPFVIAETGMSGHGEKHPRALSLMRHQAAVAQIPEFVGNVAFVGTKDFFRPREESPSGQAYHWNNNAETHYLIGEGMGKAMLKLIKP